MICHTCGKDLIISDNPFQTFLECPDMHVLKVSFNDSTNEITGYMIFWDDVQKDVRYRLESESNHTNLRSRPLKQITDPNRKPGTMVSPNQRYQVVMTINNFLPPIIKDGKFEVETLIPRLLKLKAFS